MPFSAPSDEIRIHSVAVGVGDVPNARTVKAPASASIIEEDNYVSIAGAPTSALCRAVIKKIRETKSAKNTEED